MRREFKGDGIDVAFDVVDADDGFASGKGRGKNFNRSLRTGRLNIYHG